MPMHGPWQGGQAVAGQRSTSSREALDRLRNLIHDVTHTRTNAWRAPSPKISINMPVA